MAAGQPTASRMRIPSGLQKWYPDGWQDFRNRLLASPAFQRWASRFPLTQFIARRRARELFDITAGFVYSQVLFACVQFDLFRLLANGARTTENLAGAMNLPVDSARRLLLAARSLRLVQFRDHDRFGLGELGAVILADQGIAEMIEHHANLYADLADPAVLLRGDRDTRLSRYWGYARNQQPQALGSREVADYSALMRASQKLIAADILDAYPLRRCQRLLDLAGGDGAFVIEAARRWPELAATVFDLPAVADRAREEIVRAGLSSRIGATGGDLFSGETVSVDHDVVSLVRVLHDHDDANARRILERAREALAPGGVLLIAEPMSGTPGAEPAGDAYFGFYLLAMGSGRPRTAAEYMDFVRDAGFRRSREVATARPLLTRLVVAKR